MLELGAFDSMDLAVVEDMVDLNARVLTSMTRVFLPPMRGRGRGRILNIASSAAFQPLPSLAAYAACMEGRVVEVPGLTNRVLTDWSRVQPRWVTRMIGGIVGRRLL